MNIHAHDECMQLLTTALIVENEQMRIKVSLPFCFLKQNLYECGLGPDGGGCEICPGHSERGQCDRNPHEVH